MTYMQNFVFLGVFVGKSDTCWSDVVTGANEISAPLRKGKNCRVCVFLNVTTLPNQQNSPVLGRINLS